jgi:hypothetical protein
VIFKYAAVLVTVGLGISCHPARAGSGTTPCSLTTGFGQTFGSSFVVGTVTARGLNSVFVTPRDAMPPYTQPEVGVSQKTGLIWSANAWAKFENEEAASSFAINLVKQFEAELSVTEKKFESNTTELYTGALVKRKLGGKDYIYRNNGLKVVISPQKNVVSVECVDLKSEQLHIKEAFAR